MMIYTEPTKLQRPRSAKIPAKRAWLTLLHTGASLAKGEFSHKTKGNTKVMAVNPMAPERAAKSPMKGIATATKVAVATQGNLTANKFLKLYWSASLPSDGIMSPTREKPDCM